jgi:hypothetical protein
MRRLALAIAAAVAVALVAASADARPRKRALRGHASVKRAALPGAVAVGGPLRIGSPVAPAPGVTPAPATADPAPPPPPAPAPPTGTGRSLQARTDDRVASQLALVLSRTTVLAGDVKVEFNNTFAQDPHDLVVERADGTGPEYAFDELGPGEVQRRTLALDAGTWSLSCTIPTHAERGMTAALTVAG